ncbi:MAG: hypothetical protein U2P59_03445 [Synergistota bacterium]|nr:hypothetical protein [Synergistota bacterium]
MALIKCTECGKDISDKATACPNCGCPIEEILTRLEDRAKNEKQRAKLQTDKLIEEKKTLEKENSTKAMQIKQMIFFLAMLIVVCIVGFFLINHKNNASVNKTEAAKTTNITNTVVTSTDAEIKEARTRYVEKMADDAAKEAKRINQIKYEINEQRKKLRRHVDSVENITWLYSKLSPKYISGNVLYCYVGEKGGSAWLGVVYGFAQENWVFMDRIIFNVDGLVREIPVSRSDRKTDINNGIAEWVNWTVEGTEIELLQSIADSKNTLVKFSGDQKERSFAVTVNQKKALKEVLKYYTLKKEL